MEEKLNYKEGKFSMICIEEGGKWTEKVKLLSDKLYEIHDLHDGKWKMERGG